MALKNNLHAYSTQALAVVLSVVIAWLAISTNHRANILQRIEYLLYDLRFNVLLPFTQNEHSETSIVIIDIDERSLIEQGRFPWSRHRVAKLIERLGEAGAVVIAFDVVFSEKQVNPIDEMASILGQDHVQQLAGLDPVYDVVDADIAMAKALGHYDTVLGFFFQDNQAYRNGLLPQAIHTLSEEWQQRLVVTERPGYTANVKALQQAAGGGGFVTMFPDFDGTVRRSPLVIRHQNKLYPSLALATAMRYLFIEDIKPEVAELGDVLTMTNLSVSEYPAPTDPRGFVTVPYQGKAFTYPYVSATDVLNERLADGQLEGSITLVGTSAIGLADLRSTPMGPQYPGVEVHANILDALLHGGFPYQPDWSAGAVLLQLLLIAIFMIIVLPRLGPMAMLAGGVTIIAATFFFNGYVWIMGLDLPMAGALLLTSSLTALFIADGFIRENASKRVLKGMFDQYVPPAHIEKMLADPEAYSFSGEHKLMTVLFSDIRSFTSMSEKLSARELKLLLNTYFTPITKEIFDHHGTIDKYVGDMVMAFWGAPLDDDQHRENAIKAALRMQQVTQELKPMFASQGLPEINIGVGINSGYMNVGDMGSSFRRAYTVLGDAVNLGSRLESITKFYGAKILVGEETHDEVQGFVFRFIDRIVVKGKESAIRVYEPIGLDNEVTQEQLQELQTYHAAYDLYLQQAWGPAEQAFQSLNEVSSKKLYRVYLERIADLKSTTLPDDWDGTFIHTSK